jgi:hypothetical protein
LFLTNAVPDFFFSFDHYTVDPISTAEEKSAEDAAKKKKEAEDAAKKIS